jgi:hypothetical protein
MLEPLTALEDIAQDRKRLEIETRYLVLQLISDARFAIEHYHHANAVAAAIIGSEIELWPLLWRNNYERDKKLNRLNNYLAEQNVTSTIFSYQDGNSLVFAVQTPAWRELAVYPFEVQADGSVHWGKARTTTKFQVALQPPCIN